MSNRLSNQQTPVTVHNAVAALPSPPLSGAAILNWIDVRLGAVPEIDIEIDSDATTVFTGLKMLGGTLVSKTIADDTFTADHTTETFTAASHGLNTGDGPIQLTTTGTLPAGLSTGTDYYVIKVDANTFKLALSFEAALANTVVAITDNGTGTHTLVDVPGSTQTLKWRSHGLLGQNGDGSVTVTATEGASFRVRHRPRVAAIALAGTPDTGNITVTATPVVTV